MTFNYVLIIEWLGQERRTGEELQCFLQNLGVSTCLVRCNDSNDVRAALQRAVQNVPTRGIPVVHIESHGSNPFESDDVRAADFGLDSVPGLPWTELGLWLAPLNELSEFRLLVIGATCWGLASIAAMTVGEHVAPFAALVGFSTETSPGSLHEAMKELYRSITLGNGLQEAVSAAARELRDTHERLETTSAPSLALGILRGVYEGIRSSEQRTERANEIIRKVGAAGFPVTEHVATTLPSVLQERGEARIKEAWDGWFPQSIQKGSAAYRLDWEWINKESLEE